MTLWERGGKLVLNNSGQPIDCATCPCVSGTTCCLSSIGATITLSIPSTSVPDAAGCSGCNYFAGRSFVLTQVTTNVCAYNGTFPGSSVNCFGAPNDTVLASVTIGSSAGSTTCNLSAQFENALFTAQYTGSVSSVSTPPWTLSWNFGNFCGASSAVPTIQLSP